MPYRKLKAALTEQVTGKDGGLLPWTLAEAYKALDFIHKPHDKIFEYFPPEGRAPQ